VSCDYVNTFPGKGHRVAYSFHRQFLPVRNRGFTTLDFKEKKQLAAKIQKSVDVRWRYSALEHHAFELNQLPRSRVMLDYAG